MEFFKSLKFGVEMFCKVMGRACAQAMDLLISALHIRSSKTFFLHKTKIELKGKH